MVFVLLSQVLKQVFRQQLIVMLCMIIYVILLVTLTILLQIMFLILSIRCNHNFLLRNVKMLEALMNGCIQINIQSFVFVMDEVYFPKLSFIFFKVYLLFICCVQNSYSRLFFNWFLFDLNRRRCGCRWSSLFIWFLFWAKSISNWHCEPCDGFDVIDYHNI